MSSKNDAPGFNSLKHNWGLASHASDNPEKSKPETTEITARRNAAAAFGVSHDRAEQGKQNVKKDERVERRAAIQRRLGISLGGTPAPKNSSCNVARAFGGTNATKG
ncbi:hypothetical protein GS624_01150 [Ruegeria sp. HKCCD5849]|uniref:hypothetical protein n=1 Tax=unclassified Ruegeria TaxID=2625375 RepID=UPI0014913D95|nr:MULTISPECIES: hypothetical protein [unclassified Ruegeria]NOD45911.1 hypothetical protein [Ruegeria sp. HKCCD5849]NOD50789.1 hypothetical protein [Ruegeria sp. HKCCD5851]